MIGLLLVTHGNLAKEFVSVMEHVVGKCEQVGTVCMEPNDDMEEKRQEIIDKIEKLDSGSGVLILTDMFGGTPSNLAISVIEGRNVDVLAGINLPMLIKLASIREIEDLKTIALKGQEAGRKYINAAEALLDVQGQRESDESKL